MVGEEHTKLFAESQQVVNLGDNESSWLASACNNWSRRICIRCPGCHPVGCLLLLSVVVA